MSQNVEDIEDGLTDEVTSADRHHVAVLQWMYFFLLNRHNLQVFSGLPHPEPVRNMANYMNASIEAVESYFMFGSEEPGKWLRELAPRIRSRSLAEMFFHVSLNIYTNYPSERNHETLSVMVDSCQEKGSKMPSLLEAKTLLEKPASHMHN